MRVLLRCFAFLDLISLVFLGMQLLNILNHFNEVPYLLSEQIQQIALFPMFIIVLVGAIGLALLKKFGLILYYIQFPFRLYLWVFTLGFITLLPEAFSYYEDHYFDALLKLCFVGEVIRLYLTIMAHRKLA
jgi:hypothetical protein